jgi:hypothetical protein
MPQKTDINTIKIGEFLKNLSKAEFIYLQHSIEFVKSLDMMTLRHKITKAQVMEKFKLKTDHEYENFTKGNMEYSLRDLARLNAFYVELETDALEDTAPFQVNKNPTKDDLPIGEAIGDEDINRDETEKQ